MCSLGNDREGKYITPARRQHSTSSNSGGVGGKQHMNAGKVFCMISRMTVQIISLLSNMQVDILIITMIMLKVAIKQKEHLHLEWATTKHILEEMYQIVVTEVVEVNIEEVLEMPLELMATIKEVLRMPQDQQGEIKALLKMIMVLEGSLQDLGAKNSSKIYDHE